MEEKSTMASERKRSGNSRKREISDHPSADISSESIVRAWALAGLADSQLRRGGNWREALENAQKASDVYQANVSADNSTKVCRVIRKALQIVARAQAMERKQQNCRKSRIK